jgi:hypothetical protein
MVNAPPVHENAIRAPKVLHGPAIVAELQLAVVTRSAFASQDEVVMLVASDAESGWIQLKHAPLFWTVGDT